MVVQITKDYRIRRRNIPNYCILPRIIEIIEADRVTPRTTASCRRLQQPTQTNTEYRRLALMKTDHCRPTNTIDADRVILRTLADYRTTAGYCRLTQTTTDYRRLLHATADH